MKALLIGGTGRISAGISRKLVEDGHELYLLNRGNRNEFLGTDAPNYITCDINDEEAVINALGDITFDVVCDFIAFKREHLERDYRLFRNRCSQFIFISTASCYQKPLANYIVNEGTTLANPYWQYSRDKIECENYLMELYRKDAFPITIVRPSHTYDERAIPTAVHGENGSWQIARRMLLGKPVILHGDGTSLWTMTNAKDFAVGFVGLMDNIHAIGETFQITSDEVLTWRQIYTAIADALGVTSKIRCVSSELLAACSNFDLEGSLLGDKAYSVVFDNSKIKSVVPEFSCTTRFDVGIIETVEYILAHPEYQLEDSEFDEWCDRMIELSDKFVEIMKR